MKLLKILLGMFCLGLCNSLAAQDKLLGVKGEEKLVKVLEISPDTVYYKLYPDSTATAIYATPKTDIFMVTFQNGTKEVFGTNTAASKPKLTSQQLYNQGQIDAKKYYRSSGVYWATFGSTIAFAPAGLAVGLGASLSNPRKKNMVTSDVSLLQESSYVKGYQNQAKKKKLGSAAGGVGTVAGAYAVLMVLMLAAYYH
jgi:hypothetical protein